MVPSRVSPVLCVLLLLFVCPAILVSQAQAQLQPPAIFYTDIVSGPDTGGQSNNGAFVTIYGNNFGSSRGTSTVTVGGGAVNSYPIWTNNKITVQLGSAAASGKIVVNVNGTVSNGVTFTVRSGSIYFVSNNGSDTASGSYSSPWATLLKARSTAKAGDIVYVMDGVQQTGADLSSASLAFSASGTKSAPIAFIAYPKATVTIGSATGQTYGIRKAANASPKWIVVAGMKILGATTAIDISSGYNWRVVGNDISCPNGSGVAACLNAPSSGGSKFYGNNIHDTGSSSASSLVQYEAVSLTGASSIEFGWNEIGQVRGCDAISAGGSSSSTTAVSGIKIHDNFIHDVRCNGVLIGKVDATGGTVSVYNNLLVRTGTGPDPAGYQGYSFAGIRVSGSSTGTVSVTNNTFYDCGAKKDAASGCINSVSPTSFVDNVFHVMSGELYVAANSTFGTISGNNNLFYGAGSAPSYFTSSVSGDPVFANPGGNDFRLASGSAAIDKGVSTANKSDLAGTARPQGGSFDVGAYETVSGSGVPANDAVLNVTPTSFSFGSVTVGQSSTNSGSLTNSSTSQSITLSQATVSGAGFSISGLSLPATIAPGATVNYTVKFAPTTSGSASGTISFQSDATNPTASVALSGTGAAIAVGTVAANPTSVAFGSVSTGTSSTKTVTLSNTGSASVTISSATVSGTSFTISGLTTPLTLTPGATATLSVQCAPTSATTYSGTVTINSNASNPTLSIALSGTGTTTSTSHSVDLTWNASTSSGVTGYNVYRSTTSGGPYTKISSAQVSGTSYTDSNVTSGTTYYYVVRSVNSSGMESSNSSQVTATIP